MTQNTIPSEDELRKKILADPVTEKFIQDAAKFVAEQNAPIIMTVSEIMSYKDMFQADRVRMQRDKEYRDYIASLKYHWQHERGVTDVKPVYVVSDHDPNVLVHIFDRRRVMVEADNVDGGGNRASVPSRVRSGEEEAREMMLMGASFNDIVSANSSPEIKERNTLIAKESAAIRAFFGKNVGAPKQEAEKKETPPAAVDVEVELDDD